MPLINLKPASKHRRIAGKRQHQLQNRSGTQKLKGTQGCKHPIARLPGSRKRISSARGLKPPAEGSYRNLGVTVTTTTQPEPQSTPVAKANHSVPSSLDKDAAESCAPDEETDWFSSLSTPSLEWRWFRWRRIFCDLLMATGCC